MTPTGTPLTLPLADVYVSLTAVADVSADADRYSAEERRLLLEEEHHGHDRERRMHLDSLRYARWQEESRRAARRRDRRAVEDILTANPAMVLLGDPGSGKTTLLHYLALVTARHALDADGAARPTPRIVQSWPAGTRVLPIFVPLAAYDEHLRRTSDEIALGDYVACYYANWHSLSGLAPLFAAALAEGRALVLLDGLDEVLHVATRIHVAAQAQSLFGQHRGQGNRFVVTSRVIGYREAPLGGLAHVTAMPFGDEEIAAFAHQWCAAYEAWARGTLSEVTRRGAVNEEKALLTDVNGNESVKRLAANPLLLTMRFSSLSRTMIFGPRRSDGLTGYHPCEALPSKRCQVLRPMMRLCRQSCWRCLPMMTRQYDWRPQMRWRVSHRPALRSESR